MFSNERKSLLGIGTLDGTIYFTFEELVEKNFEQKIKGLYMYLRNTIGEKPLPWKTDFLRYKIIK